MTQTYSLKDVALHSTKDSPWFIVNDKVYDATGLMSQVCLLLLFDIHVPQLKD